MEILLFYDDCTNDATCITYIFKGKKIIVCLRVEKVKLLNI